MMKVFIKHCLGILLLVSFSDCKKKKQETVGNDPPSIELVSVTPSNVKEFKDSITVTFKYKDINGDLGDDNPDELSLEVKDSRLQKADGYHVQPLAPDIGKDIPIEGELKLKLNSMFLLGGGTTETSILTIKVKDRAGNWSNEISTQQIIITK